jgi:hypothetical protein
MEVLDAGPGGAERGGEQAREGVFPGRHQGLLALRQSARRCDPHGYIDFGGGATMTD